MNRSSLLAFASLAALLGVAAGCDSSASSKASHSAEATCARLSACGVIIDVAGAYGESFADCQALVALVDHVAPTQGSDYKRGAAFVNCGRAASTCDELRACSRPTAAQAAVCNSIAGDTCSGNTVVNCSMKGTSREVTAYDCAKAGLICGASSDGANCGIASCDPASTPPICNGNLLVTCDSQGNVLNSHDCRQEGRACRTNSTGQFDCVGDTVCDSSTSESRCEGTTEVFCDGGTESRFDCSTLPGMTCGLIADTITSTTSMSCKPIEGQCVVGELESCQNGVIAYCNAGLPATFDCRSVGFSGCMTQTSGARTIAGCVL